ncbi:MAG: hypothetical protein A2W80_09025 [Candidatus Riflebacteria bacterium GWC2_50_8]|nr:MAG: hypothetical protein A2W80_09025 [Candidatus Riflebacteria bacterium GWC2_50_8]
MEPAEFLHELKTRIGGDIVNETRHGVSLHDERGLPHLTLTCRDISVKIDFVIKEELMFTLYATPPRYLVIRAWNLFERMLSMIPFMGPCKFPVGDEQRFFLVGIGEEDAKNYFTAARAAKISALFPFVEIEQKERVYRCLKGVNISLDYTPDQAVKDLNLLIDFVELTRVKQ